MLFGYFYRQLCIFPWTVGLSRTRLFKLQHMLLSFSSAFLTCLFTIGGMILYCAFGDFSMHSVSCLGVASLTSVTHIPAIAAEFSPVKEDRSSVS